MKEFIGTLFEFPFLDRRDQWDIHDNATHSMTGGSTTFERREKLEREGRRGVNDTAIATLE